MRFNDLGKVFKQEGHEVHALVGASSASGPARRSGSSASPEAGRRRSHGRCSESSSRRRARSSSTGRVLPTELHEARSPTTLRALQIVFQNPDSALNRRHAVRRILLRSLRKLAGVSGAEAERQLADLANQVRLTERTLSQKPVQLSGGLKQRVAIARAFAGDPQLVVCDEPTSALDVSVQAAILNLLVELQAEKGVSYLFISHDLGVVRYISDRIAVLYLGRLQELGPAEVVFDGPHHPYTEALLSAVPTIDGGGRDRIRLEGDIPSAASPPSGCVFHTRCPRFLGVDLRGAGATARRGRGRPPHALPHPDRGASRRCRGKERATAMKIRGVVLETDRRTADGRRSSNSRRPGPRRCSSASARAASATRTGTPSTEPRRRCARPCSGHEGAGVVEAVGDRVDARRRRRPRRALVDAVVRHVRGVRSATCRSSARRSWPAMAHRRADGRHAAALARRRAHLPLLASSRPSPRLASSPSAPASRSPRTSRSTSRRWSAARFRRAPARSGGPPACRPGDRVAVVGCGGVGSPRCWRRWR